MKNKVYFIALFLASCVSVIIIISFLVFEIWFLDLFNHFYFQYLIILTFSIITLVILKRKIVIIFIPAMIFLAFEIFPFYLKASDQPAKHSHSLKVISFNVLSSNGQFNSVVNEINSHQSDIVILEEFTELWRIMLEPELDEYPFRFTLPRTDNFGIAIYSKVDFAEDSILYLDGSGIPTLSVVINYSDVKLNLLATHPLPPVGKEYFDFRNQQFESIVSHSNKINGELLVIGDLNSSSFSPHFKSMIFESGLIDSRKGFELLPTWPTWFPLANTTLDHALVSNGIFVKKRGVGRNIGSDHLPIIIEIEF